MTARRPRGVHLVGSLPYADAEEAFRAAGAILGDRLRRLPDGETGVRARWVGWQADALAAHPDLEAVPITPERYFPTPLFRPRGGVDPAAIDLGTLGYGEAARASLQTFLRLKKQGAVPEDVRFQLSLPTPFAGVVNNVAREARAALFPAFERAMRRAVEDVAAAAPPEELAVQWDVCIEIGLWDPGYPHFELEELTDEARADALRRLVAAGEAVPAGVELGYHFCYGDFGHVHFVQPRNTRTVVTIANALLGAISRGVEWIHLPVPRFRTDELFFAPLRELRLPPSTELYLGLVHYTDGVEGALLRIEAARSAVAEFGIAAECGLGRRPPGHAADELLGLHRELSDPVR